MKRLLLITTMFLVTLFAFSFMGAQQVSARPICPDGSEPTSDGKCPPHDDGGGSSDGYTDPAAKTTVCTKDNCDIIDNFINPFIKVLSIVVGLTVVIGIIWGAIQVSMSGGDPQKVASGKNHIRNAIIAVVAYVLLFIVLNWLIPGGIV